MKNLFDEAMSGIGEKVALQEIRKVLRGKAKDQEKLEAVVSIVHTYEDYAERAELDAERRAIEADEAEMRRQRIDEMFENMAAPVTEALTFRQKKGETDDK